MTVFIVSDTHFNHKNIIWFANRPFSSVEEMNERMIANWNSVVGDNDLVIHLGDFVYGGIGKIREIRSRLNGDILLIKGNHDRCYRVKQAGITMIKHGLKLGNIFFSHKPVRVDGGLVNVHGHIHHWRSNHGINACVEHMGYIPVPIEYFFKKAEGMVKNE